jgi:hypothetical protein
MKYYQCRCGAREAIGTTPPPRCASCPMCETNLALGPEYYRPASPHEFTTVEIVRTPLGPVPVARCCHCHQTRDEIAAAACLD